MSSPAAADGAPAASGAAAGSSSLDSGTTPAQPQKRKADGEVPASKKPKSVIPRAVLKNKALDAVRESDSQQDGDESQPQTPGAIARADAARKKWRHGIDMLKRYKEEFGTARVPQSYDSPSYPGLGRWIATQRRGYRNEIIRQTGGRVTGGGRITPQQISELESLGFVFKKASANARPWPEMLESLKQFKEEYGSVLVPQSVDTPKYPKLGSWVCTQRNARRYEQQRANEEVPRGGARISEAQIKILDDLGFAWAPIRGIDIPPEAVRKLGRQCQLKLEQKRGKSKSKKKSKQGQNKGKARDKENGSKAAVAEKTDADKTKRKRKKKSRRQTYEDEFLMEDERALLMADDLRLNRR